MSQETKPPFERDALVTKPGIVGARWWQESLKNANAKVARRSALGMILGVTAVLAGIGSIFALGASSCAGSGPDVEFSPRPSLDIQREFGWNFGARDEPLTFDGVVSSPFDRGALAKIDADFHPSQTALQPYFVPTLFQAPWAIPKLAQGEVAALTQLKDVLVPIFTPTMDIAYRRGVAFGALFAGVRNDIAVIVDLPGPESVAFTAGTAPHLDPVFTFDNWPHPRGVVPAHLTLAACAYYQPLFARHLAEATRQSSARPLFVLDRRRLSPYTDEATTFDNRYLGRLPSPEILRGLGVKQVLYVVPSANDLLELDDLNDDFLAYVAAGLDVRALRVDAFWAGDDAYTYFYGGSAYTSGTFWADFPWAQPNVAPPKDAPRMPNSGAEYVPVARTTPYSSGSASGGSRPRPTGFGTVPVAVAVGTGVIVGLQLARSGSWNRSSGGFGG